MSENKENKLTLNEQAKQIIKIAEAAGVQTNFFFITTFKRYRVQINILNELERRIEQDGALVTKEYVKGRGNLYTHPAIAEYNRTTDSANKTVGTLIKIIKGFKNEETDNDVDPLLAIINGGVENDAEGM
jgi:tRNA(Phe) wybutosine-synthesizing methylase Tyw3